MYIQEHCKLIFSKKESIFIIFAIFSIVMIIPEVDATIKSVQFERYTEAIITYPDGVILGQQFTISFFVKNESTNIEKKKYCNSSRWTTFQTIRGNSIYYFSFSR